MAQFLLIYTAAFVFRMPYQENYWLWKTIGYAGIATFGSRFVMQWIHSERHGESRITPAFWWQSLFGTILCLFYFLRQKDSVGVLGYVVNIVPYSRNLVLVYRKKRKDALAAMQGFPVVPPEEQPD